MTPEEAEAIVKKQGFCTPQLYSILNDGREWNGHTRFVWFGNVDLGYRIKYTPARGGSQPNPDSESQRQPWIELGISQATYYRRKFANKRWSETFTALGVVDTPANRATYTHLAKTAEILGRPVGDLWREYLRSLGSGESASSLSSSDNDDLHILPPGGESATESGQPAGCTGKGLCEACHVIHR